jgi:thiamine monophosphate synthase
VSGRAGAPRCCRRHRSHQVRERDLDSAALAALVAEVVAVTRGSPTRVVVNDRIDVALAPLAAGASAG